MGKGQLWDKADLNLVLRLFKEGRKQKEINTLLIADRKSRDVWQGEKDLSNRISRLSPRSKHRAGEERKIRVRLGYKEVVSKIMKCLRVSETIASKKYTDHIYLSGIAPYDFLDPNQRNLVSIRYEAPDECKSVIYFAFTSEDYDDGSEEMDKSDVWTVRTKITYTDVITGRVSLDRINNWLYEMAKGKYVPIFLNTLIYKKDD